MSDELFTASDLNDHERVTLIALLRASVFSDGGVSEEEHAQIRALAAELGEDGFAAASTKAEERGRNVRELCDLIEQVERKPAQEFIYAALLASATSDYVDSGEADILEFIETNWEVEATFPELPEELKHAD